MTIDKRIRIRVAVFAFAAATAALAAVSPAAAQQGAPAPGTFLAAVLVTDDAPAASAFYSELFGWDMEQAKDGGFAVWHKGRMIAGIAPLRKPRADVEESFWLVGLMVEDVDRSLAVATKENATIHEDVDRVSDYGRFAVAGDRQGAPVLLIEPGLKPLVRTGGHGSWRWAELWTDDIEDAAAFYGDVFHVEHETVDRGGQAYHVFTSDGKPRAGIVKIPEQLDQVEPGWAPYVAVEDLGSTLGKVKELGGRVIFGEMDHPADAAVALIMDPSGAVLFIYQIGSHEEAE
jgi:predicted enzyme related to lactoylglutathione lyase